MKKLITAIAMSVVMTAGMMTPVMAGEAAAQTEEDGQNPVMNYIGTYGKDRCTIEVTADGSEDASVLVTWSSSAWEHNEWQMSGPFDYETRTITYENATEKTVTFNDDGELEDEKVIYENGKGSFTFDDNEEGTVLTWNDEEEHVADDMEFTNYLPGVDVQDNLMAFESSTSLEDGILTVSISPEAAGGGFYWSYVDEGDGKKVELVTDTTDEKGYAYVGSFRGIEDGDDVIRLVFGNGVYVQQYRDFNVTVKDGEITECTGGSAFLPTLSDDLADVLEGTWTEADGNRSMNIELNAVDGFDVTVSDGSGKDGKTELYAFTAYYDAIAEGLIYRDGTTVEAEITAGDETEAEVFEKTGDGSGIIMIGTMEDNDDEIELHWQDASSDEGLIGFVKEA